VGRKERRRGEVSNAPFDLAFHIRRLIGEARSFKFVPEGAQLAAEGVLRMTTPISDEIPEIMARHVERFGLDPPITVTLFDKNDDEIVLEVDLLLNTNISFGPSKYTM
jgi:hypothetical protein